MNRYIIVLSTEDKKVERIVESQPVDGNNVEDVAKALSTYWLGTSAEFPSPRYDIIWGAWDSIRSVQGTVGRFWNWESASYESLSALK